MKKQFSIVLVAALLAACGSPSPVGEEPVRAEAQTTSTADGSVAVADEVATSEDSVTTDGVAEAPETNGDVAEPEPEVSTDTLAADLQFMREEEKLARDVYLTLHEAWGVRVFDNIARSEQRHTDSVRELMVTYGVDDPVTDDSVGVFQNQQLAQMYADLVSRGLTSVEDALTVGATVEDLDIMDLRESAARTDKADVRAVYQSLECGSYNHLRAFVGQLDRRGASYAPQFLSDADFATILAGSNGGCG